MKVVILFTCMLSHPFRYLQVGEKEQRVKLNEMV